MGGLEVLGRDAVSLGNDRTAKAKAKAKAKATATATKEADSSASLRNDN
jgi:hypothetical protein